MKRINIKEYEVPTVKNNGISKEWSLCRYFGIERTTHDNVRYDKGSDIETDGLRISVKTPRASLMSGTLCKGCDTFDQIWERYSTNTHSRTVALVLDNFDTFFMNLNEFSAFIYKFGALEHESKKNGGHLKIKIKRESEEMRSWLYAYCN